MIDFSTLAGLAGFDLGKSAFDGGRDSSVGFGSLPMNVGGSNMSIAGKSSDKRNKRKEEERRLQQQIEANKGQLADLDRQRVASLRARMRGGGRYLLAGMDASENTLG